MKGMTSPPYQQGCSHRKAIVWCPVSPCLSHSPPFSSLFITLFPSRKRNRKPHPFNNRVVLVVQPWLAGDRVVGPWQSVVAHAPSSHARKALSQVMPRLRSNTREIVVVVYLCVWCWWDAER